MKNKVRSSQSGCKDGARNTPLTCSTIRNPTAVILFLAIAIAGLAGDLLSKHYVFESLLNDPVLIDRAEQFRALTNAQPATMQVLHQFQRPVFWRLKFTLSANPGVVFGWPLPRWVVVPAMIITIGLIGAFFVTAERTAWLVHMALACILSGALGNLYDRLFSRVAPLDMEPICRNVRDFIDCSEMYYPWTFNVADVLLVIGVGLLVLHWILASFSEQKKAT